MNTNIGNSLSGLVRPSAIRLTPLATSLLGRRAQTNNSGTTTTNMSGSNRPRTASTSRGRSTAGTNRQPAGIPNYTFPSQAPAATPPVAPATTAGIQGTVINDPYALTAAERADIERTSRNTIQPFYDEQQRYKLADLNSYLGFQQGQFDDYLNSAQDKFKQDRLALDQGAAETGMLFSGSRNKDRNTLQTANNRDIEARRRTVEYNMNNRARQAEYDIGSTAFNRNNTNTNLSTASANAGGLAPTFNWGSSRTYNNNGTNYLGNDVRDYTASLGEEITNRTTRLLNSRLPAFAGISR